MKLRNLLFATMFACTFASCSNEDDPISTDPVVGEGPATLSVQVQGAALTKGFDLPTDVNAKSKVLSSLTLIVFNGTGDAAVVEAIGTTTDQAGLAAGIVTTPEKSFVSGSKSVLVLANLPVGKTITVGSNKEQVLALTANFNEAGAADVTDNEVDGKLTMNSKLFTLNLLPGLNVYGRTLNADEKDANLISQETVKLYRNVALIHLASIVTKDTKGTSTAIRYQNPKLSVKSVFIMGAVKTTKLVGENGKEWGSTVMASDSLTGYSKTLAKNTFVNSYLMTLANAVDVSTTKSVAFKNAFYAYENTGATYTKLVVKADFIYDDLSKPVKADGTYETAKVENTYYTINVGQDVSFANLADFATLRGTLEDALYRNLQYNINLTVTGPGSKEPGELPETEGNLSVKVEVVDFGTVSQNVEQ